MEHIDTITKIISENAGKSKEELKELVLAVLPSIDHETIENVLTSADAKAELHLAKVKKSLIAVVLKVLKNIFQSCRLANAVHVAHPPTPPLKAVVPTEEPVDNELPPLEPNPEKV